MLLEPASGLFPVSQLFNMCRYACELLFMARKLLSSREQSTVPMRRFIEEGVEATGV